DLALGRPRILIARIAALLFDFTVLGMDFHRSRAQLHVVARLVEDVFLGQGLDQGALVAFLAQYPTIVFVSDVVVLHAALRGRNQRYCFGVAGSAVVRGLLDTNTTVTITPEGH